ncbi:VCBS domain-containing protein [Vibrio splendidus]|uniref:VCBS domain-containing protein n=1 Tax=Vibrio splendidus TaxID=29497 RepID=UPI0021B274E2|nr:VCBS domain-containing protein [Vibrio splendidus]
MTKKNNVKKSEKLDKKEQPKAQSSEAVKQEKKKKVRLHSKLKINVPLTQSLMLILPSLAKHASDETVTPTDDVTLIHQDSTNNQESAVHQSTDISKDENQKPITRNIHGSDAIVGQESSSPESETTLKPSHHLSSSSHPQAHYIPASSLPSIASGGVTAPSNNVPTTPSLPTTFTPEVIKGIYGELHVDSGGKYTFVLNPLSPQYVLLHQNQPGTDKFVLHLSNGSSVVVQIPVTGKQDVPTISGDLHGIVTEDSNVDSHGLLNAAGKIDVVDPDHDQSSVLAETITGKYGTLTIDSNGAWHYQVDNSLPNIQALTSLTSLHESFTIHTKDGTPQALEMTIGGIDDNAVVTGLDSGTLIEDLTLHAHGQLTVSDPDLNQDHFQAEQLQGHWGSLSIQPDGTWTYDLDNTNPKVQSLSKGSTVTDIITVHSADGTPHPITIAVNGTNDNPTINQISTKNGGGNADPTLIDQISSKTVYEGTSVISGQITATDLDHGDTFTFSTRFTHSGFVLNPDGSYTLNPTDPSFNHLAVREHETLIIPITATDNNNGQSVPQNLVIRIDGTNDKPVVSHIGSKTVNEGDPQITGQITATDIDHGDTATFATTYQHSGFSLNSDGSYTLDPTDPSFNHLAVGEHETLIIPVTATDNNNGQSAPQNLVIRIDGTNDKPVVSHVSSKTVNEGDAQITGQITATDLDHGDTATFATTYQHAGFTLNSDGSYTLDPTDPSFNHLAVGEHETLIIPVTATDNNNGQSAPQNLVIRIDGTNDKPVVSHVSSKTVSEGDAQITGQITATDIDHGDTATFATTYQHSGFSLNSDGSYTLDPTDPSFNHLAVGEHETLIIPITATDNNNGQSAPQNLIIRIDGTNDKPVVSHIGSKTVNEGDAQITGQITATDIDHGDTATFATTYQHAGFTLNSDGSYTLDPTDPSFDHLAVGEHETLIIPITATDNNNGQSAPQNLIIRIDGTNNKPVVSHIGSKTVNEGDAQITGQITATDLDHGDTATFATTYQHAGFTLNSDGSYTLDPTDPSFNHLAVGEHETLIIPVTATDNNNGQSAPQNLIIRIDGTNDKPVVSGVSTANVIEQGTNSPGRPDATGTLTASDLDTSDTVKWTVNQSQGKFGTLSIDQHGHWHYQLDNSTGSAADKLASGQHQPESFWITAIDSAGATVPHKIVIDVQGSNDKPVVSAWTQLPAGKEDQPVTIKVSDLLTHTSDVDSTDTLNVSNLQAAHGSIIDNKDGTYTFTPDKNFNGEIRLTYNVIDGHGGSASTQAKFDLTADPDSAVITDAQTNADLRGVTEDRGYIDTHYQLHYDGKLNIQDPDSGEAQFDPNIGPQTYQGIGYDTKLGGHVLLMRDGHYTYTLDNRNIQNLAEDEVKQDSVVIRSVDGTTHTIELTVHGTNDKPTIAAQSHSVTEDGQLLQGQMVGTDIDNGAQLTYSVANPVDGLTLNKDGSYSFDPSNSAYQHLADKQTQTLTIPVTITDEHNSSSTENLTITITGTGDAAIIGGVDTGSVIEKTAGDNMSPDFAHPGMATLGNSVLYADGQLTVVDPDTGEQGFAAHTNAYNYHGTYGDLILNTDGSWHYVADAGSVSHIGGRPTTRGTAIDQLGEGEVLTDTITVHSKDNTPHDIVITIHGSNDRPYCSSEVQLNAGTEDTRQTITVAQLLTNTVDVDHNDTGLLTIENLHPDHGSVAVNADGSFSFTPEKNYNGQVHFTYDVKDGHGGVTHTGATTNLAAVNDNPDVTPITDSVTEDTDSHHSVNLLGTATDIDGDPLTISHIKVTFEGHMGPLPVGVSIAPDGHSLIIDSHSSAFQHLSSGEKSDITIQYMVEDNHGGQAPAVATITVVGSDDKAQLQSSTIDMTESQALHTYYQLGSKVAGTLNLLDPDSTDHTQFSFSGNSGTQGYGNLTIWPDGHYEYDLDMARNHHANDKVGSLKAGESLTDQYQVQTSDGQTKVITVTIHGEDNNARIDVSMPHILPATQQVTEEHFVNASSTHLYAGGMLKVIDPDHGDAYLQAETINTAHHGEFKISASGSWNYSIDNAIDTVQKLGAGESFTETHTVHSLDGTASQLITVTVRGTNDAPVVSAQVKLAPGTEDTDIQLSKSDLLSNVTDIDHNDIGHLNITNLVADHGVIVDNKDGTFNFHPAPNYNGQVHFSYDVIDGHGGLAHASASTTLAAVKDAAVFSVDDTGSVKEDVHVQGDAQHTVAVSGVLLVSDPDAGESEFVANRNVHAVSDPFGGDLSIGRAGDWTYSVPNNNLNRLAEGEKHQVTYEVVSRGGDKHQIVITVIGTNDDPQLSVTQTTPTTGTLTETDVDVKDMHTFSVVSSTGQFGSLSVDPDTGAYVYTANSSVAGMTYNSATHTYHGADVFEVKVADNHGGESSRFLTFDTNGHVTVISGQQPSITTTVPQNPAITKTQPSLPTGSNTPPSNAVTVDLTASSDSGKSNTDNLTNNTTPTITGHTDIPYSQVTVYDGSTPIGHAVSDSSGQYSIAVSSLSNGDHNLSAKALAPSSALPATSSLLSVHVDTTIAPLTIGLTHDTGSNTSDLITSDGALTITGQEAGATVEYSADNGQTWVSSFTPQQGSNTVSVRQTDAAGNVSASTSLTFTLDDQIAAPSIDLKSSTDSGSSSTDDLTNIHTPIITGSAEANSIISITDETGKVVATGTTNSNGIYQLTTSDIAEGKHTLTVSTTDVAGNQNSATLPIEVDYTAPTISKVNLKTETTHQPTFSGTVSLDTTSVDIVIKSGSTIVETLHATLDGKGGYTVDATNLPDRTYTAYIQATDKSGNQTPSGYAGEYDNFSVDTHAKAPTISFESTGSDNIYNAAEVAAGAANTITASIHLPDDVYAADTLIINGVPHLISNTDVVARQVNVEVSPGSTLSASIIDSEGNQSTLTSQIAPTADLSAAPLTLSLTHDTGSSTTDLITNDGALTISGQEAGAIVEYSTDNGTHWSQSFTAAQGANTVTVRQTDSAGNVSPSSSLSFTLDNQVTAPSVSLRSDTSGQFHPTADLITQDARLSIQTEAGAQVEYSNDGGQSWTSMFNPIEGVNNLLVRQTDIAGNQSATTHFSFTLDTTPGTVSVNPISTDNALNVVENNQALVITGTTSNIAAGDRVYLNFGNNHFREASVNSDGTWSLTVSASDHQRYFSADGSYPIKIGTVDLAGNATPEISTHLIVDTQNPIPHISVDSVTHDNIINLAESGQNIDITGHVSGDFNVGDVVSLSVNGATISALTGVVDSQGNYSISVPAQTLINANIHSIYASGQQPVHSIEATVITTDQAGNIGSATTGTQAFSIDKIASANIQLDPVTADNVINAAESNYNVSITGHVSGDVQQGDTVNILVGQQTHTGIVDQNGQFSIDVAGSELTAQTAITATVDTTDNAGNPAHASQTLSYTVDTQVDMPTITFENPGSDNAYSKAEIAQGHAGTITATVHAAADAKIGEHININGVDHVLDTHSLQNGLQIEVAPGSHVQVTMTDEHGNTAASQGFAASAIPEPIIVRPPSGSHQVSGTLGVPPLLPSLTPVPTAQSGWRIHLPNGQYVTSHHGQYGTLTIDPQTGHLHYQEQAQIHTGPHGSASGIGQHEDRFEVALQGTNQDEVVAHVNIQILSHGPGHSGKLTVGTEVVDMTITPVVHTSHPAPPPPPPVQHDEPDMASQADFTVTLSDDSNLNLTHQEPDEKTSHHGAAAYLDALGIKPDATSTTVHDQPADMDIVLAQVDQPDAATHDQAHLDMSDALEHHDVNINHNQDDEHHHHNDVDGLPDIDPNS